MTVSQNHEQLRKQIDRQVRRMEKAQREHATLLSQTVYIGVLGLVFVLPVVAGAYLGRWLDTLVAGYSIRWTLSMLFIGVVVGAVNVFLLVRE
jgi:ATP synthase protein I